MSSGLIFKTSFGKKVEVAPIFLLPLLLSLFLFLCWPLASWLNASIRCEETNAYAPPRGTVMG